jgi:hypothetical protein
MCVKVIVTSILGDYCEFEKLFDIVEFALFVCEWVLAPNIIWEMSEFSYPIDLNFSIFIVYEMTLFVNHIIIGFFVGNDNEMGFNIPDPSFRLWFLLFLSVNFKILVFIA